MLVPSAVEILRTIETTLDSVVKPVLTGTTELSAMATVSHLLRHVSLRVEQEGQILLNDIEALKHLLADIAQFCDDLSSDQAAVVSADIHRVLATEKRATTIYPSLSILATEAGKYRQSLFDSLAFLQSIRDSHQQDSVYIHIRQSIRTYIADQIRIEGVLIDPAFDNRGPRR